MPKITVMYIITVIGGFFYVSRFPEKILPGEYGLEETVLYMYVVGSKLLM